VLLLPHTLYLDFSGLLLRERRGREGERREGGEGENKS